MQNYRTEDYNVEQDSAGFQFTVKKILNFEIRKNGGHRSREVRKALWVTRILSITSFGLFTYLFIYLFISLID